MLFSQTCVPGSKRKIIEVKDGDDNDDSDVEVIETKKKVKLEEQKNENITKLSNEVQGTPSVEGKEVIKKDGETILSEILNNADEDVIDDVLKIPAERTRNMLLQRSQQLRDLRKSICQLLGLLVPEINLPRPESMPLDDNTIDVLLRDVLDASRESTSVLKTRDA